MRVGQIVGQRIKEGREELSMTQDELGRRLEQYLGKAWSRQAVSLAESGQRSFTAAELVAIAHVLGMPSAGWLLSPPIDVQEVELPTGMRIDPWMVSDWAGATSYCIGEMAKTLARLNENIAQAGTLAQGMAGLLESVKAEVAQRHYEVRG